MKIWLITVGEPLPIDGGNQRLLRAGILANLLIGKGHNVVWWTSTFNHASKRQRHFSEVFRKINNHYKIWLLYGVGYKTNISISRIVNHYRIARKFRRFAELEAKPDIILCSMPTIELSVTAVNYGKRKRIPVVLDIRDLWPDIFLDSVPKSLKALAQFVLYPMFRGVRSACSKATAITGITPGLVSWGVKNANRELTSLDRSFPYGYPNNTPDEKDRNAAFKFWEGYGIRKSDNRFIGCFFGAIGHQFELETIIDAGRKLAKEKPDILFVLCGDGDKLEYYKELSSDCKNILFSGWVGAAEIWTLMRMSSVALAPYPKREDYNASLPNKVIEYFSAGLPIVSSLVGYSEEILNKYDCGLTYKNHDVDGLVSSLARLYDDRERLKAMSENALDLYNEQFTAEKVYGEMINYLEEIVEEKAGNGKAAYALRSYGRPGRTGKDMDIGNRKGESVCVNMP